MDFLDKQIAPPTSWTKFEDLCRSLFAAIWKNPLAQKNGRSGQAQNGVDVFGRPSWTGGSFHGVQCKGKNGTYGAKATRAEILDELAKAETFRPALGHWTFATTAPNDGDLQQFVRELSDERVAQGKFPIDIIGWDTVLALMADEEGLIERYYPEHGVDLPRLVAQIRAAGAELAAFRQAIQGQQSPLCPVVWSEVDFTGSRDLGPALMGRPLGSADVDACPELPEAAACFAELKRAFSARLSGVPGAGKSVSALQTARKARDAGWRVVRLRDPQAADVSLVGTAEPTLHLIDDAHLLDPAILLSLEQSTHATAWLLTTHTMANGREAPAGAIHLDAARAVRVIAARLKAHLAETLAVVSRIDSRVSDRPMDESLDHRLADAAGAETPWRFCFILGGGWRRADATASAARQTSADVVLAAAAIRQLASRDAPCSADDLRAWALKAGVSSDEFSRSVEWMVRERMLISADDLRCPHQRLASVLLGKLLAGQTPDRRKQVGQLLGLAVADASMPLAGVATLLVELRMADQPMQWVRLLDPARHAPLIDRCLGARDAVDVRGAAFVLTEIQHYSEGWPAGLVAAGRSKILDWFSAPPENAGYAIGGLLGQISMKDEAEWRRLIEASDATAVAKLINESDHERAGECAAMGKLALVSRARPWADRFLAAVDRDHCLDLMASWPETVSLWLAAEFCEMVFHLDAEFGLDLAEALAPACASRLRGAPTDTYDALRDLIWHVLRLDDSLGIYTGKSGPTPRMKSIGRKLTAMLDPERLAWQLSRLPKREFQSAAYLLKFILLADRRRFEAVVGKIDWDEIGETIGEDWSAGVHDLEIFLGISHSAPKAAAAIAVVIEKNSHRISRMSTRLALMAPSAARTHVSKGGVIGLTSEHFIEWGMGVGVLANFAENAPQQVDALLAPHEANLAKALSSASGPPFFEESLLFLRLLWEISPSFVDRVLDHVETSTAEAGWSKYLGGKAGLRKPAAFLVHLALMRPGQVAEMAHRLRARFPTASTPPASVLARVSDGSPSPAGESTETPPPAT